MKKKTIIGISLSTVTALIMFAAWWYWQGTVSEPVESVPEQTVTEEDLDAILKEEQDFSDNQEEESDFDTDALAEELPVLSNDETPGEETVDDSIQSAKALISAFRIEEAKNELQKAEDGAEKFYYQAVLLAYEGKSEAARAKFTEAKQADPGDALIVRYADEYLNTYDYYDTFSDPSPEYLDVLISQNFLETGELQLAIAKLKYVISVNPDYKDAQILLGSAYMIHGNLPKAIETLTQALPTDRSEVYYWLGLAYYYDGNYTKAQVAFKQAMNKKFKPLYKVYEKLGDSFLAEEDYSNAAFYYEKAALSPEGRFLVDLYIRPVWLYNDILKEPEKGIELSEKALEYNPDNAMVYNLIGWSYIAQKEYDRALEYLEFALEQDDSIAAIYLNLGLAYIGLEEIESARINFEAAIELDDGSIQARARQELENLTVEPEQEDEESGDTETSTD